MNDTASPSRARRFFLWFSAVLVVVVAGWGFVWWMIAETIGERIDDFVAQAAVNGTVVDCADRTISGWPFRVHVACAPLTVRQRGGRSVSVPAFRAVALIYKPRHIIMEADAPADISFAGDAAPGAVAWRLGQASLRIADTGPTAVSVSFSEPRLSGFGPAGIPDIGALLSELHLRRAPGGDAIDMAIRVDGLTESPVAQGAPIEVEVLASLPAALMAPPTGHAGAGNTGQQFQITRAGVVAATTRLSVGGALSFAPSGRPDGTLTLTVVGPDDLEALLTRFFPFKQQQIDAFRGAVLGLGKKSQADGVTRHVLPITIRDGAASVGLIPLGTIGGSSR